MNIIVYIKNSIIKILYFISIFTVINLILLTSSEINASINDIAYMDFLIIVISLFFLFIYYYKFKSSFCDIYKALENGEEVDNYLPDAKTYELELIKNIVKAKNHQMEENAGELKDSLDEVNDYITKWVHEIKIPIAVCELISDKIEEAADCNSLSKVSEELRMEIERIKFLINQVLYTSRSSSYSEDLQVEEVSINKVIREMVKRNAAFFIAKDIDLQLNNIDYKVMTDEKWASYIIDQIINNACKYVNREGEILIYGEEDEKSVKINIRDNGMGICEKDIRRIFDKGFTGENGRKTSKSTGMGLYLSKKMANKLSHDIFVKSEQGSFTEFTICYYKLSDYFSVTKM
ncbi:MAG: sensor histidine kinase [Clostridiaceae bacterium]